VDDAKYIVRTNDPKKSPDKVVQVANGNSTALAAAVNDAALRTSHDTLLINADGKLRYQTLVYAIAAASDIELHELRFVTATQFASLRLAKTHKNGPMTIVQLGITQGDEFSVIVEPVPRGISPARQLLHGTAALRDALKHLRKQYGDFTVHIACDRDTQIETFVDAAAAIQASGIENLVFLAHASHVNGAASSGDQLAKIRQQLADLEGQQKQLMGKPASSNQNQK
jgi:biopolymer transport protein ExbD